MLRIYYGDIGDVDGTVNTAEKGIADGADAAGAEAETAHGAEVRTAEKMDKRFAYAGRYIFDPGIFFNNTYEDDWITDPLSVEMIKDIDQSDVISPRLIDSPFLGPIPPERIARGTKALILMKHDDKHIFNASVCGDNCARWILRIGREKGDLLIRLGYLMDFGEQPFEIEIDNLGLIVHNRRELIEAVLDNRLI